MRVKIFTTGGTIDKIYFDSKSEFEVGDSVLHELLRMANVRLDYQIESILRKDSSQITPEDRQMICERVRRDPDKWILITHGTDTMVETARSLESIGEKVIVLTGSMQPARFRESDASFNIGGAFAAVQILPPGVYIAMNGQIFRPERLRKNFALNCFEEVPV